VSQVQPSPEEQVPPTGAAQAASEQGRQGTAPPASGAAAPPPGDSTARKVGLGFLFILTAKVYFLITGFAVQFGLPRLLLRAARRMLETGQVVGLSAARIAEGLYGDYGVAVRTVSWINNTMVQGTIQAVSKYVAEDEDRAAAVKVAALRVQAVIGGCLAALYFALSGLLATLLSDSRLTRYFRITAVIILAYAIYAVFIGTLNGLKRFSSQAGFDMTFATLKTASILVLAGLGYGVAEVLGAFSGSAVAICLVAAVVVGVRNPTGVRFPWRVLLKAMLLIGVYYVFFNSLLTADLLVLKALASRVIGPDGLAQPELASSLVGVYTGVLNVALLPYQGVLAVAFVAFPLISRATFEQDAETSRAYIRSTLRYSLIFVGLVAVGVGCVPEMLLGLINPSFVAGAPALRVYVAGEVFFALFAIANTIIIASGRMSVAAGLAAAVLGLDVASNLLVVPRFLELGADGFSPVALLAAACATAPVFVLGFGAASVYLARRFGATLPLSTGLRVLLVGGGILAGSTLLPRMGLVASMAVSAGAGLVYLLGLLATRELTGADLGRLRSVLRKG